MKKNIFAALILVLVFAGSAMAQPYKGANQYGPGGQGMGMKMGMGSAVGIAAAPEMKVRMDEMARLHNEIRLELQKENPNKARARELHTKIMSIRGELDSARFEEMLKDPAKFARFQGGARGGARRMSGMSAPDKAKMDEIRKLREEIRMELGKQNPDRSKIMALHKKAQGVKNNLDDSRLEEMLKNPGRFGGGRLGYGFGLKDVQQ